jgi:hypothetical protein
MKQVPEVDAEQARSQEQRAKIVEISERLTNQSSVAEIIDELTRIELSGELPEFYVLIFRAILGMIEGMEHRFVTYYLEMAEGVVSTDRESVIAHEIRTTHDSLQLDVPAVVERCLLSIERRCHICGLIAS